MGDPAFHHHTNRSKVGRWVARGPLSHGIPSLSFLLSFLEKESVCSSVPSPGEGEWHLPTQPRLFRGTPVPGL